MLLPKNLEKNDSLVFTRSIINSWAVKAVATKKSQRIIILKMIIQKLTILVKDYRQALLINGYKERLIKQQLDTFIEQVKKY